MFPICMSFHIQNAQTLASEMEDIVPKAVRNKRSKMLRVYPLKNEDTFTNNN